ncbi:MAG: DUF1501 domain-containing protein [Gemmataceae bacterium]
MLLVGDTHRHPTRRAVLQAGASAVLGLSLAGRLRASAGDGKSILLLWLWGGPPHHDTFDPKPDAPLEIRGPFATIPTRTPGLRFTELFPQLAALSHRFAIIRSLNTQSNDHGVAGTIGLTGSGAGAVNLGGKESAGNARPTIGSVVAKTQAGRGSLPAFCVVGGKLHQGKKMIAGEGGGHLGAAAEPFRLEVGRSASAPALRLPPGLTPERLADRGRLLAAFDNVERTAEGVVGALDENRRRALELLTSPAARAAFDLSQEPDAMRARYGLTRFGQSCLLARRLIERNVPFVQVNWSDHVEAEEDAGDGGWDHHYRNFQLMQDRHGPWLDESLSALLMDLHDRGLLEKTMVLAVGEFGRSPKVNDKAGREHWPQCYSALVAGGGVVGGRVIGTSDARGERPADTPLTPGDLAATCYHVAGVTSEQSATLGLTPPGRVIEELF